MTGLTGCASFITLRIPMSYRVRFILLFAAACVAFPERSPAPVIFRPSDKVKYRAPGEEEISGNANELFAQGEAAQNNGDASRAIKFYKRMVKRYPRSDKAPEATFRAARLMEQRGDLLKAAPVYRGLMETYPQTPHFQEAIESQFRIGEILLNGKKRKILGVPVGSTLDEAVEIFAGIVRSAPYGRYTARAQFDIGRARRSKAHPTSRSTPTNRWWRNSLTTRWRSMPSIRSATSGSPRPARDLRSDSCRSCADCLSGFPFPLSEKRESPQARENLAMLQHRVTKGSSRSRSITTRRKTTGPPSFIITK